MTRPSVHVRCMYAVWGPTRLRPDCHVRCVCAVHDLRVAGRNRGTQNTGAGAGAGVGVGVGACTCGGACDPPAAATPPAAAAAPDPWAPPRCCADSAAPSSLATRLSPLSPDTPPWRRCLKSGSTGRSGLLQYAVTRPKNHKYSYANRFHSCCTWHDRRVGMSG